MTTCLFSSSPSSCLRVAVQNQASAAKTTTTTTTTAAIVRLSSGYFASSSSSSSASRRRKTENQHSRFFTEAATFSLHQQKRSSITALAAINNNEMQRQRLLLRHELAGGRKRTLSLKKFKDLARAALADVLFTTGTVMVMPFYGLMISRPKARVTRHLMESKLLWFVLGLLYAIAAYLSLNSEDVVHAVLNAFSMENMQNATEPFVSRCLTLFSNFMSTPETACASWLHLISLDVFLARDVFLDGAEWGTPCKHSILLCCMFGPLGVLSHAMSRYLHRRTNSDI